VRRHGRGHRREALLPSHGDGEGLRIASRVGKALPAGYVEASSAESAAADVAQLDALTGPDDLRLSLQPPRRDGVDGLRMKLYRQLKDIPLSDVLPMMENMGLRVMPSARTGWWSTTRRSTCRTSMA